VAIDTKMPVFLHNLWVANFAFLVEKFGSDFTADPYYRQQLKEQNHKPLRLSSLVVLLCVTYFLQGFLGVYGKIERNELPDSTLLQSELPHLSNYMCLCFHVKLH
jgi:hypothetical protein